MVRNPMGQHMTHSFSLIRRPASPNTRVLLFATAVFVVPAIFAVAANAQTLGYAPAQPNSFSSDYMPSDQGDGATPERLRRAVVAFNTGEAAGTIVITCARVDPARARRDRTVLRA